MIVLLLMAVQIIICVYWVGGRTPTVEDRIVKLWDIVYMVKILNTVKVRKQRQQRDVFIEKCTRVIKLKETYHCWGHRNTFMLIYFTLIT